MSGVASVPTPDNRTPITEHRECDRDAAPLAVLRAKAMSRRIPLAGTLELTHRCNWRCLHCYAGPLPPDSPKANAETPTDRLLSLIDEIADAGCLFLLITGGEPLLHADFPAVYRRAKLRGMLVTVFTNATLISDDIVALFRELPPRAVEVTLYGATAETARRVTDVEDALDGCLRGIERLNRHRVPMRLKATLLTLNVHETSAMAALASRYAASFRVDSMLTPRLNGDRTPLRYRLAPEQAVDAESAVLAGRHTAAPENGRPAGAVADPLLLYRCGAGRTAFNVDPYGDLQPCMMVPGLRYSLIGGRFGCGWRGEMSRLSNRRADAAWRCAGCEFRSFCKYCPGQFFLENGSETVYSPYHCQLGRLRAERLGRTGQREST